MNNIVSITNGKPTISSFAIAEGVGNTHKSILQLVRLNLNDFEEFGRVAFQMRPFDTTGGTQIREVAILNEHHATLLMTFMRNIGVVKEFKKRLVREFYLLADKQAPQSFGEALRLAADQADLIERQKHALDVAQPKVEFHDQVTQSLDTITIGEAAKILGTGRVRLFSMMRQAGWLTRNNEPYQSKIEQGYLDVKLSKWTHPDRGLQRSITPLITGRGLTKLQQLYNRMTAPVSSQALRERAQ